MDTVDNPSDFDFDAFCDEFLPNTGPVAQLPTIRDNSEVQTLYDSGKVLVYTWTDPRTFLFFNDVSDMVTWLGANNHTSAFEVIKGGLRKLYIDIDYYPMEPLTVDAAKNLTDLYLTSLVSFANAYFSVTDITADSICVIDGSGHSSINNKYKFSLHFVFTKHAASLAQCLHFATSFKKSVAPIYQEAIDLKVYNKTQQWRMSGMTKKNDNRYLRIISGHTIYQSFVRVFPSDLVEDYTFLPDDVPHTDVPVPVPAVDVANILENTREHFTGHTFWKTQDNLILFKRGDNIPKCEICDRIHQNCSNNALYFAILADGAIVKKCLQSPGKMVKILAGDQKKLAYNQLAAFVAKPPSPEPLSTAHCKVTEICDEKIPKFVFPAPHPDAENTTTYVHAGKRMGKTEELARCLTERKSCGATVVISNRLTFTAEIQRTLPGFTSYNDIKGKIDLQTHSRIIVQVESLQRLCTEYNPNDMFFIDMLILDESESICQQHTSPHIKHPNDVNAVWKWLLEYSNNVIAMDANMTDRTINLLKHREGIHNYIHNTFKNDSNRVYQLTRDKDALMAQFEAELAAGKRIFFPTNSKTQAEAVAEIVRKKYPEKTIEIFTANTPDEHRTASIANISVAWKTDVLIISPTITAGVSFKEEHFDLAFAWFESGSCNGMDCDQMIGRVRCLKEDKIITYLSPFALEAPVTKEQIKESYIHQREATDRNYHPDFLHYEIARDGTRKITDEKSFELYCDNAYTQNRTRSNLTKEFMAVAGSYGAKFEILVPLKDDTGKNVKPECDLKTVKAEITFKECEAIAAAPELTLDDAQTLKDEEKLTIEDKRRLQKRNLRELYRFEGEMNGEFVATYNRPNVRHQWMNIVKLTEKGLHGIQEEEKKEREGMIEKKEFMSEVKKGWVFDRHRLAHACLKTFGFEKVTDDRVLKREEILKGFATQGPKLLEEFDHIKTTFKLNVRKKPQVDNFQSMQRFLNAVIELWYGIKVISMRRVGKDNVQDDFRVERSKLFDYEKLIVTQIVTNDVQDVTMGDLEKILTDVL